MTPTKSRLLSFDEALAHVLSDADLLGIEPIKVEALLGRTLAEPIATTCDLPLFDNSAVDGYAITEQDLASEPGKRLALVGESKAGSTCSAELSPGTAIRVFTGAPIPKFTAAVVMQEHVELDGSEIRVDIIPEKGANIRRQGEEALAGTEIIPRGTVVGPSVLAALCSAGISEVAAVRLPKIGLLVTGDELLAPGKTLGPGQVYESNGFALGAAVRMLRIEPILSHAPDEKVSLEAEFRNLIDQCDVVITSGGVSVGGFDLVREVFRSTGIEERFWGVALKPGKPFYFGKHGTRAVFGLPGNPVSALTTFFLLVRPYLQKICGRRHEFTWFEKQLNGDLYKATHRTEFVPGRTEGDSIVPLVGRASHKSTCLAEADALILFPESASQLESGARVNVISLRWGWDT